MIITALGKLEILAVATLPAVMHDSLNERCQMKQWRYICVRMS